MLICLWLVLTSGLSSNQQLGRGRSGIVVSADPIASQVGVEILKGGGNAVDAAVAVSFVLAVVYPEAGNIGGGGFMLIHEAGTGKETSIDYREKAPSGARGGMYLDQQGRPIQGQSTVGYRASGVPGSVAGMHLAWKKFGRLPWEQLIQPSMRLARTGFRVSRSLSVSLRRAELLLSRFPESRRIFLRDGKFYQEGEIFSQPQLAGALELISREGPRAFYEGQIAGLIAQEMDRNKGSITAEDLKNYEARIREPIRGFYRGYEIISMGPPSSGGVILVEMLNMIESYPLNQSGFDSRQVLHLKSEVMRRGFVDRAEFLGDPDFSRIPLLGLTSKEYALQQSCSISPDWATPSATLKHGDPGPFEHAETTHFSVVDREGNAVAVTTTINGVYGSGVTIPGAGFLMNNEMDDFSSKPGVPNMFGLLHGERNAIKPNKRPLSAMAPTLVKWRGEPYLILGSRGGPAIINTVFQIIVNVIDHGFSLEKAVGAPRIHHQWLPDQIVAEPEALVHETRSALEKKGHRIVFREKIGEAHCIFINPKTATRLGVADPRSEGSAYGY